MKKLLPAFLSFLSVMGFAQTITPVLYPLYMQGHGTSAASDEKRVPYTCRMSLSGLAPNTIYYYFNRWAADPVVPVEQGGIIFAEQFGNWRRTTSPSLGSVANRDTLITDGTGSYTGWFVSESGIALDFAPGSQLYFRLVLDVPGGTNPIRITAAQSVTVLAWDDYFDPVPVPFVGTGVRSATANTAWLAKNFIMLYDNTGGTGRPIAGTYVENDGVSNTTANGYVGWYAAATTGVNAVNNRWGTIIPDALPDGIRRIAQYSLSSGGIVNSCTDTDGDWGGTNGNTVNPAGGGANDPSQVRVIDCAPTGGCAISLSSTQANVLCFGASTGAVNLTVIGATAPVFYSWSNSAATEDLNGIPAGSYTVTVTDAASCTATWTVTITQPVSALAAAATATNAACGNANGSVNLTVSGGTASYTYLWSNSATTEDINTLAAGTYTVTVTDANGCNATASATVNNTSGPSVVITGKNNVLCFGQSSGSINITATGGTAPYSYLWNNSVTTEDISSIAAGNYNVIVTDASGCTATATASITQPASAITTTAALTNATCGASNGSVNMTVNGGTPGYTYLWNNGATTEDISGLVAGTYSVIITDANGCTKTTSVSINNSGGPNITITSALNVLCFGQSTGSVNITISGGTSPYTYLWSNGATTEDISGVVAAAYTITVTDANGCATTASANILQPINAISANTIPTNVLCFGQNTGSVNLTISGGTAPYTFIWNNGAVTEDINGLTAGTYNVTIKDANGCTASASATIIQPSPLNASETHTSIVCFGGNSTVTISATGGTSPYTGTGTFNQPAGTQSYVVTDANGCTKTINVTVTQPSVLTATASSGIITCNDGSTTVIVAASGGTLPYTGTGSFTRGAGTWNFTVTDANGCTALTSVTITVTSTFIASSAAGTITCSGSTTTVTVTATGGNPPYTGTGTFTRGAGAWSFTVTDGIGCTAVTTISITEPPGSFIASSAPGIILCNGGGTTTVIVTATGGTAPYTGTGTFTHGPGSYSYTVTDANGCTAITTGTINEPSPLVASAVAPPITICGGETTVIVSATGGSTPYPYPGVGNYIRGAGTWNFTVKDARGCTAIATITIAHPECLKVQPNPVTNNLIVSHTKAKAGAYIYVYTIHGAKLLSYVVQEGSVQSTLNMSKYSAGMHVLLYYNNNEKRTIRFEKINDQ